MRFAVNRLFVLMIISAILCIASVSKAEINKFELAKQQLNSGARAYNMKLLEKAKGTFIELGNEDASNYMYPYYTGLAYLAICNIKNFEIDKSKGSSEKKAKKTERVEIAEEGLIFIDKSIELKSDLSDSYRVKGALISYKISGMVSGMRYGGQAEDAINAALKFDPNNALAKIETARKLIYNPAIAGGDLEEGIKILNEVIKGNPQVERSYILLGLAYEWLKEKDKAISTYKSALDLNPLNAEAKFYYDELILAK